MYFKDEKEKEKFFKEYHSNIDDISCELKNNIIKALDIFNIRYNVDSDINYGLGDMPIINITARCYKKGQQHFWRRSYDYYLLERIRFDEREILKEERRSVAFSFATFLLENQ